MDAMDGEPSRLNAGLYFHPARTPAHNSGRAGRQPAALPDVTWPRRLMLMRARQPLARAVAALLLAARRLRPGVGVALVVTGDFQDGDRRTTGAPSLAPPLAVPTAGAAAARGGGAMLACASAALLSRGWVVADSYSTETRCLAPLAARFVKP